jgi:hypothetical protein
VYRGVFDIAHTADSFGYNLETPLKDILLLIVLGLYYRWGAGFFMIVVKSRETGMRGLVHEMSVFKACLFKIFRKKEKGIKKSVMSSSSDSIFINMDPKK